MSDRTYRVEFTARARRQLAKLDRVVQARVLKAASLLARHPRPPAARRLSAESKWWRIRVGDYRVVYKVDDDTIVVTVVTVGHRSAVYRI